MINPASLKENEIPYPFTLVIRKGKVAWKQSLHRNLLPLLVTVLVPT